MYLACCSFETTSAWWSTVVAFLDCRSSESADHTMMGNPTFC